MANYTTAQKVADLLGIDSTLIKSDWIDWADNELENRLGRSYTENTITKLYDGTGTDILVLDENPITAITKVEYLQDYTPTPLWYDLTSEYWRLYAGPGYIRLIPDMTGAAIDCSDFAEGVQNWRITYKYGYVEVPKIVEFLATLLVAEMYNIKKTGGSGAITSERIGQYSVTFDVSSNETVGIDPLIEKVVAMILGGSNQTRALGL